MDEIINTYCTDCLLDLTDACLRGAGRAIDDEICDTFFPRETYEVNKNESWQLGYQQGRADAINEVIALFKRQFEEQNNKDSKFVPTVVFNELIFNVLEQMKSVK